MKGILYGVGVGPGDPELMTIKAVKIMNECDVIVLPAKDRESSIAYKIASLAAQIEKKEWIGIEMPMTKNPVLLKTAHDNGADRIKKLLLEGKKLAFLVLGDPSIYATYSYIHKRLTKEGFQTEVIPGIPSFCAVAARLNEPLVEKSEQLHIIPASYQVEDAIALSGTKVFLKAGSKMPLLKNALIEKNQHALMVENCGMKDEKVYKSTADINENASYYSIVIVKENI